MAVLRFGLCLLLISTATLVLGASTQLLPGEEQVSLAGDPTAMALFRGETMGVPQGGAILLGDSGTGLFDGRILAPLRLHLPQHGWSTLTLTLPPIAESREETNQTLGKRLDDAIALLAERNIRNVVIIGHGTGGALAVSVLAQRDDNGVTALIGINLTQPRRPADLEPLQLLLTKVQMPVLDLFGGLDQPSATGAADRATGARMAALAASRERRQDRFRTSQFAESSLIRQTGLIAYRQMRVDSADHWFSGLQDELVKRIRGWLTRHAVGVQLKQ